MVYVANRYDLAPFLGQRLAFCGTYSHTRLFGPLDAPISRACLVDVWLGEREHYVTAHAWVLNTLSWLALELQRGDKVYFAATVCRYSSSAKVGLCEAEPLWVIECAENET